jgi:soluble lytic murein transglycosylase
MPLGETGLTATWRHRLINTRTLIAALTIAACSEAFAQTDARTDVTSASTATQPLAADHTTATTSVAPVPYTVMASALSAEEVGRLRQALRAARSGNTTQATMLQGGLSNPIARKLVTWAMIDAAGSELDFATLAAAQRDLVGFPRPVRLRASLEKSLERAALAPAQVIALFQGRDPETAEGAMALAAAYQMSGRTADAQTLIRHVWRNHAFAVDAQSAMLTRFGGYLTADDHAARLDMLLYTSEGPSAAALLGLVTPDQRAIAQARIALRAGRSDAPQLVSLVPAALQTSPGLAFDRARFYRKRNLSTLAAGLVQYFPSATPERPEVTEQVWIERRALMFASLQSGDNTGAYAAAAAGGLQPGAQFNEAQFFAGWVALTRLKNADLAEQHFAKLQGGAETPITLSRAYYWRGRAASAKGDALDANLFWGQGAKYYTTFYGQLSAAKVDQATLQLGSDPVPTAADRAAFESLDVIRAARMLGDAGERDLFTTFVMGAEEDLTNAAQLALLVDMTRLYGDQWLSMRVVRAGAMRGLYLPDRGYPVRMAPTGGDVAEPAFVFAIARQESSFDPFARSPVGARGMMQLMPRTAAALARRLGVSYSPSRLDDADYNMRLGAGYLDELVNDFSGSYVLATAAYNAGPGRPPQWITACGDPRTSDPTDFIECIPFSETRDYVMRVMEAMQVYRARLRGGAAPLTLAADLKRGGWAPSASPVLRPVPAPVYTGQASAPPVAAMNNMGGR